MLYIAPSKTQWCHISIHGQFQIFKMAAKMAAKCFKQSI